MRDHHGPRHTSHNKGGYREGWGKEGLGQRGLLTPHQSYKYSSPHA